MAISSLRRGPKTVCVVLNLFVLISFLQFSLICGGSTAHSNSDLTKTHTHAHEHAHEKSVEHNHEHPIDENNPKESCCENSDTSLLPAPSHQVSNADLKVKSKLLEFGEIINRSLFLLTLPKMEFRSGTGPPRQNLAIHISSTILRI